MARWLWTTGLLVVGALAWMAYENSELDIDAPRSDVHEQPDRADAVSTLSEPVSLPALQNESTSVSPTVSSASQSFAESSAPLPSGQADPPDMLEIARDDLLIANEDLARLQLEKQQFVQEFQELGGYLSDDEPVIEDDSVRPEDMPRLGELRDMLVEHDRLIVMKQQQIEWQEASLRQMLDDRS